MSCEASFLDCEIMLNIFEQNVFCSNMFFSNAYVDLIINILELVRVQLHMINRFGLIFITIPLDKDYQIKYNNVVT